MERESAVADRLLKPWSSRCGGNFLRVFCLPAEPPSNAGLPFSLAP